jgi:hypothetical protein
MKQKGVLEMEIEVWKINGIDVYVEDALIEEWKENGKTVRLLMIDACVLAESAHAFMEVMYTHLGSGRRLAIEQGALSFQARFAEFIYAENEQGVQMRLALFPQGYDSSVTSTRTSYIKEPVHQQSRMAEKFERFVKDNHLIQPNESRDLKSTQKIDVYIQVENAEEYLDKAGKLLSQIRG